MAKGDNDDGGEGIGAMRLWPTTMAAGDPSNLQRPLSHVPGGRGADEEGGAKTTIGGGERGNGRKNGAATMTTANMVPTQWHRRHGRSDNQLYNDNNCGERGQGSGPRQWQQNGAATTTTTNMTAGGEEETADGETDDN